MKSLNKPNTIFSKYLLKFIDDSIPRVFIECGANNGLHRSIGLYYEKEGWSCINIEANPYAFKELIVNRPSSINLNFALSKERGSHALIVPTDGPRKLVGGGASVEYSEDYWTNIKSRTIVSKRVEGIAYNDIFNNIKIKEVGIFILDVEGHEISVLQGMQRNSFLPHIFVIENDKIDIKKLNKEMERLGEYKKVGKFANNAIFERSF